MSFSLPSGSVEQCIALPGVPGDFINIIGDVERRKLPYTWALHKNEDGFSLTLKTPARAPMRMRGHFERRVVNKDTSSRRQDNIEVSSCSVSDIKVPIHDIITPKKKKSPSCKQRDRNRRRRWKRKKKSLQSLDLCDSDHETVQDSLPMHVANANPSVTTQGSFSTNSTDSVHDAVPDSLSLASRLVTDANQIVEEDTPTASVVLNTVSTDVCDDDIADDPLHSPEAEAGANDETLSESPDSADDYSPVRYCFYCNCFETETDKLKLCKRCNVATYCSKECQTKHWKGIGFLGKSFPHRMICNEIVRLRETTEGSDSD